MIELNRNDVAAIDRLAAPVNALNVQKDALRQAVLYGIAVGIERAAAHSEKLWRDGYRGEVNTGFGNQIRAMLRGHR